MDLYTLRRELAGKVRFLALDGDGVIFPNTAVEGLEIEQRFLKPKDRSHYDGQGISFLRGLGIHVCVITNAEGVDGLAARELVERWNGLRSAREGRFTEIELFSGYDGPRKLVALEGWLAKHSGTLEDCAVMGNDIGDYHMLKAAGLSAAPADAEPRIREMCLFVAERSGGYGAIRDLANFVLEVRGVDPTTLSLG